MEMKKIIAAIAATAVSAASFAAFSMTSASAADEIAQATLMGSFGTESSWDYSGTVATVTSIDGDAQYQCEWNISEATNTGNSWFLTVVITPTTAENFTTDTFPDLGATIDQVFVDGEEITGFDASSAVDLAYYESNPGVTRLYLRGDWAGNSTKIIEDRDITSNIKVVFTISGLGVDGTSNVTSDTGSDTSDSDTSDSTEATTAASDDTSSDDTSATTAADSSSSDSSSTTTAADSSSSDDDTSSSKSNSDSSSSNSNSSSNSSSSSNSTKTETSADTGDAGVGLAAAALVLAGTVALAVRKKK